MRLISVKKGLKVSSRNVDDGSCVRKKGKLKYLRSASVLT